MKAIILAAGYATRMYPLTENQPKALLPIKGKAVIDYIIDQINNIPEIDAIYVVTNRKFYPNFCEWANIMNSHTPSHVGRLAPPRLAEQSEVLAEGQPPNGVNVRIEVLNDGTTSNEDRRGAVGDVQFTIEEKAISDDLFIIASDNFFTFDLREQLEVFRRTGCDTLSAMEMDDIEKLKAFAVAKLDENGKVLEMEEKPQQPQSNTAVYASYFFRKETVPLFKEYLDEGNSADNIGAFPAWLSKNIDVYAYKMNGECYDIGTIEMYEQMNGEGR
jgi:glucose-1-phosphate thymidylyltransferase